MQEEGLLKNLVLFLRSNTVIRIMLFYTVISISGCTNKNHCRNGVLYRDIGNNVLIRTSITCIKSNL